MIPHQNRAARWLLFTASLFFLGACASTPPEPDVDFNTSYNFSGIKTLALAETTSSGDSARALMSDMQINRINIALTGVLEAKGFQIVEDQSKADALINWHLAASDKQDIRTSTTPGMHAGYGRYNRAVLYNCWNCGSTEVYVHKYTEGTFIVDIVDPALRKSVWRSVTQSRLKGKMEKDPAAYTAAAQLILAAFPPQSIDTPSP
jgi:Domain of unknown function (DUF4136)